ncbi:MAG: hypothetical protein JW731_13210 [Bacteroidales bacterium]|nr:hypothetical protein [Bacteroidales bacterium]
MKILKNLTFICFALVGILGYGFAMVYLFRPEYMPYHAIAVDIPWEELTPGIQVLILALMRVAGGGWLATSVSITFFLVARKKYKSPFFSYALVLVGISALVPTLIATLFVKFNSPANPPWIAAVLGIAILIVGLILDFIVRGKENRK